jgi:hypothetical protein
MSATHEEDLKVREQRRIDIESLLDVGGPTARVASKSEAVSLPALAALGGVVLPRVLQADITIPADGSAVVAGPIDLNGHTLTLGTNAALGIIT